MTEGILPISAEGSVPSDGFNCFWLKNANGVTIGDVYGPQTSPEQQELCNLIVKAVNNHDALVEALRLAQGYISYDTDIPKADEILAKIGRALDPVGGSLAQGERS